MVISRDQIAHQQSGTQSSLQCPTTLAAVSSHQARSYTIGQRNHSGISQPPRGHQKCNCAAGGDTNHGMGGTERCPHHGYLHTRGAKLAGRLPQPAHPGPRGMAIESGDISSNIKQVGDPICRHDGFQIQHATSTILCKNPRLQGGKSGRVSESVGLPPRIRVPSHSTHSQGHSKDKNGKRLHNSDSTMVASTHVVRGSHSVVASRTMDPPSDSQPSISGTGSGEQHSSTKIDCMAIESQLWRNRGFSPAVTTTLLAARKASTARSYYRVWQRFLGWSESHHLDWKVCRSPQILEFLQHGLDKGLSVSALKVQLSALSSLYQTQWAILPEFRQYFQALLHLYPPHRNPVPPWDLNLVLGALQQAPFEPMDTVDIKYVSWKVAFLLAICSGRRVSDLTALSYKQPWLIFHQDKAVLRTVPSYLPKVTSAFHINQEIVLPSFCPKPSSPAERQLHKLDPVRALKFYLKRSSLFRKADALLVLFGSTKMGQPASRATLARWIVSTISESYTRVGQGIPSNLKAHSTRKISASWALQNSASPDMLCKAATWSSLHTFSKFYKLDVLASSEGVFGRKVLQAAVAST
ncbi:uncharacterized protein LOC121393209 [Xenopus laevis]|uniref:Uncharacterized protein LOC121393209 n=1 Tax=Xenopus laevis TaxID=8355 RepID=A0A8J1KI61_XENLA|nr:uncharacterized protein LOC121393209 [Xenopus laevis]